jgi:hypothetical protein
MSRTKIALLCVPLAAAGLGVAFHATYRVNRIEKELAAAAAEGKEAGASFVQTLRGSHAERQRLAFDRRRERALGLAAARRDRLLGLLLVGGAGLCAAALSVLSRIAREVEEDRRHVTTGSIERPQRP